MLDVNYLEANTEEAIKRLNSRGSDYRSLVEKIIHLNQARKINLAKVEHFRAQKNQLTREISQIIYENKDKSLIEVTKLKISKFDKEILKLTGELEKLKIEIKRKNSYLPNLPAFDVPFGKNETENVEIKVVNTSLIKYNGACSHWEIAQKLG